MTADPQLAREVPVDSWPMPRHDASLTGYTSLRGQIRKPEILYRYPLGAAKCSRLWTEDIDGDGNREILTTESGRLLAVTDEGKIRWQVRTGNTPVVAVTDLDGDGRKEIVLRGPEIRSAVDGRLLWRPSPASARHEWRIHTGSFLPEYKGQQIVTVTMRGYDLSAHVYTFENGTENGRILWSRKFQTSQVADFGAGMISDIDQDGDLELCVAVQGGLVALDLRTGEEELRFEWEVDGKKLRNYGQIAARDVDGDGRPEVVLVNTQVALQVAVVKIRADGTMSLLWNRHWGDWYPNSPYVLHVALFSIASFDGKGSTEIAVSVYERGKGWNLQMCDARNGRVLAERSGLYLESVILSGRDGEGFILASEQRGMVPARFTRLRGLIYQNGELRDLWHRDDAHLEGSVSDRHELNFGSGGAGAMDQRAAVLGDWDRDGQLEFVISEDRDKDGRTDRLAAVAPRQNGPWNESGAWSVDPSDDVSVLGALAVSDKDTPRLLLGGARGHVWSLDEKGAQTGRFSAGGSFLPEPAVADINGDGENEIVVGGSDGMIRAAKFTRKRAAQFRVLWRHPGWGTSGQFPGSGSPVLADLDGDGLQEILIGVYERGRGAGMACLNSKGLPRWKWFWPAGVPGPEHRPIRGWTVGRFGGRETLDVFLATHTNSQTGSGTTEESWVLNGITGHVLWHKDWKSVPEYSYKTLGPSDLPSVADLNGDGRDDVLMMSLALVVLLNGRDGTSLRKPIYPMTHFGEGTPWTANGSIAVRDLNGDGRPELLLTASHGAWGAMTLGGKPLWSIDPGVGTECRRHGGLGDVDGDGNLELGMPHPDGFRCYDAATGDLRWQIPHVKGSTDVVAADIDGDGKDEFIFGTGSSVVSLKGKRDRGFLFWSLDLGAPVGAPIVADVNCDGLAEILVGTNDGVLSIISGQ